MKNKYAKKSFRENKKEIKKTAYVFRKKHKIKNYLTLSELYNISNDYGWNLRSYALANNLIHNHKLQNYAEKYKAFTYSYKNEVVILYNGNLNYEEKINIICHEFGHIKLGHIKTDGKIENSKNKYDQNIFEEEAETFAKELLKPQYMKQKFNLVILSAGTLMISIFLFTYLH